MGRGVEGIQAAGIAHGRAHGQGFAPGTCTKIHHHLTAPGIEQQGQQLRAFILHLDEALLEELELMHRRLVL